MVDDLKLCRGCICCVSLLHNVVGGLQSVSVAFPAQNPNTHTDNGSKNKQ